MWKHKSAVLVALLGLTVGGCGAITSVFGPGTNIGAFARELRDTESVEGKIDVVRGYYCELEIIRAAVRDGARTFSTHFGIPVSASNKVIEGVGDLACPSVLNNPLGKPKL